jgi:hypothetical protein
MVRPCKVIVRLALERLNRYKVVSTRNELSVLKLCPVFNANFYLN